MAKNSEARLRANAKYDAVNTKRYSLKFNYNKEEDAKIIKFLDESKAIQATIRAALIEFMKNRKLY